MWDGPGRLHSLGPRIPLLPPGSAQVTCPKALIPRCWSTGTLPLKRANCLLQVSPICTSLQYLEGCRPVLDNPEFTVWTSRFLKGARNRSAYLWVPALDGCQGSCRKLGQLGVPNSMHCRRPGLVGERLHLKKRGWGGAAILLTPSSPADPTRGQSTRPPFWNMAYGGNRKKSG